MPSINFTISAEDKNLQKILKDIERGVNGTSQKVVESGMQIDDVISRLSKGAASLGAAFSAQQFAKQVMDVRGEFQQLEVAFNTILGSEEKAAELMSQLTQTAATTPFGLQDVANGAKQLLAYGVATEEVNDNLIMLGDIAAGLSIPLNDLVYLYGTTMTQGRMYTQDMNQFMGRGIPLAEELAKQFGVTKAEVKGLVTEGKVGFNEMHKALVAMTSEGGKFGGLMANQSKTIVGQISNLEDSIDMMFNEIGKSQEGVINSGISLASKVVENYEEIGTVLMGLVGTYGAYRAALMLVTATEKIAVVQRLASIKSLNILQAAYALLTKKVAAFNALSMANPFVIAATAVAGLVSGAVILGKTLDKNGNSVNRLNEAIDSYNKKIEEMNNAAKSAIRVIQDESASNTEKVRAYNSLKELVPDITSKYKLEELAVLDLAEANKELAKWREEAESKARKQQITELQSIAKEKYNSIRARQITGRKVEQSEIDEYKSLINQIKDLQAEQKEVNALSSNEPTVVIDEKALKEQLKAKEDAQKALDKLTEENQDNAIALLEEGYEKELAVIKLAYERRAEEIDKLEEQFRAVGGGKLTNVQKIEIETARKINEDEKSKGEVEALKNKNKEIEKILKQYQSLIDKYKEAERKFDEDRAKLISSGANSETIAELDYQKDSALDAIALEMAQRESAFKSWMDTISLMTLDQLRKALTLAKQELALMEKQSPNSKKTIELRGRVTALEEQMDNIKPNAGGEEAKEAEDDWKDLYETLNDISDQFGEIGELVGDTAGELMSLAGNVATGVISMIDGVKAVGKTGAEALKPVEKASVILAIIGTAIQLITKIVNLANELHDKKHEKEIQKLQSQVDTLEESYEKLGEAIDRAFSKDASNLINQQNELLKQQKELIKQQISEEDEKKKTDSSKIEDWKKQLDDIDKKIAENKEKAIDAIFGEDINSAIENFAESYSDAIASGGDKWVSVKDTVKSMMKQMVVESIKGALQSSNAIENIRKKLLEFYQDGIISMTEQDAIYKMAEDVQKELDRQFGWADNILKDSDIGTEQKATYGGFETMSEDTGSELNGRFTALQMAGEEIKNQMISSVVALNALVTSAGTGNSLLSDILTQHAITNAYLEDIVKYSKTSAGYGAKLDKIVEQTKNL